MPDVDTFEQRLGDALRSDADTSVPRFDPAAIARVAVLVILPIIVFLVWLLVRVSRPWLR